MAENKPAKKAAAAQVEAPTVEEKNFIVKEADANALLAQITQLPWNVANPLIQMIQATFKPQDASAGE